MTVLREADLSAGTRSSKVRYRSSLFSDPTAIVRTEAHLSIDGGATWRLAAYSVRPGGPCKELETDIPDQYLEIEWRDGLSRTHRIRYEATATAIVGGQRVEVEVDPTNVTFSRASQPR